MFDQDAPTSFSEKTRERGPSRKRERVYATKVMNDGTVEAYDRAYHFLGTLTSRGAAHLALTARETDRWEGWTGGRSDEPGRAHWWKEL